jgi:hypothetical protein
MRAILTLTIAGIIVGCSQPETPQNGNTNQNTDQTNENGTSQMNGQDNENGNDNGAGDICPPAIAEQADCDNDGLADECAIAEGLSSDCDENAIPDECDVAPDSPLAEALQAGESLCEQACRADVNGDGVVNESDRLALLGAWGQCGEGDCPADTDGDGQVGQFDLNVVLANFLLECSQE